MPSKIFKTPYSSKITKRRRYRKSMPPKQKKTQKAYVHQNARKIMHLSKQVSKLKAAEFGQKQINRQVTRTATGLPDYQTARISADYPMAFLHQAISQSTNIYQVTADPISGAFSTVVTGTFAQQDFPLIPVDPTSIKFDQLKYLKENSIGVQPGYLHMSTIYNLTFLSTNWRGWVEVLLVTPRAQYTRQAAPATDDFQMPTGLPGFARTCGGTINQYYWNPLFYNVKRLKRMYFNTQAALGDGPTILTNPNRYCQITVHNNKFRSHIRAQKSATTGTPVTALDIPLHQQDWLVFTASNLTRESADSHMAVTVTRCPVWRDPVGSS